MTAPRLATGLAVERVVFGLAVLLAVVGLGCGLVLDLSPEPPTGQEIECFVTVVNPDGVEVDISSRSHPDFVEAVLSFSGGGGFGGGSGGGTRPIRPFFVCPDCGVSCGVADPAAAEAQWRRWINQRITEVASGPPSESPFSVHPGPWCVQETDGGASTLRCELRENLTSVPSCGPALTAEPLLGCPGAPPTGTCLEVSCDGTAPCSEVLFPPVNVGASLSSIVTVRNCGAPDDGAITVSVDDRITPILPLADFFVPDASNGCLPRTPEEMRDGRTLQLESVDPLESSCQFEIQFEPGNPSKHEAEKIFPTSTVPAYRIYLTGEAIGGVLVDDAPDLVCLNTPAGSTCSAPRTVRLTNNGPGDVTIDSIEFGPMGAGNFRILQPPPPTPPVRLAMGGTLDVRVEWCPGGTDEDQGDLTVDVNSDPPFAPIQFEWRPTACPPGS